VLFSSHILADVERIADRIGILHGGRLIVDAKLEDLKSRVQKRFARSIADRELLARKVGGVLACRQAREGYELTLLDFDEQREAALRELATSLSDPAVPTLEELFIELTGQSNLPPQVHGARGAA
jgi:ABC-2 type transport system ATP-binding protein